jgi:aldehyde:ferredoxin oxidoreductase
MAIQGGFQGKLLEVDLTGGQCRAVSLPPDDVLRMWVGGTGLGLYLLAKEITPQMRFSDPECPIFIMTGPLTGTMAPNSSNWTIINLRDCPDYHPGLSQAHGYWGARLKHAGWDGIIVRGVSSEPVYLWIDDDRVELRDASPYWGLDTYETVRRLQVDHSDLTSISVACIGPGGENLITGASVRAERAFGCQRGEAGMAWGSKKLKAIAVRGSGRVPIADMAGFMEACEQWNDALYAHDTPPPQMHANPFGGSSGGARDGRVPSKNFSDPAFQVPWCHRLAEDSASWKVRPVGSWQCEMACHHETVITTGEMAGLKVVGYAGEAIQELGANLGVEDPGVALALSGMVDALGLDAGEVPRAIAMVMEAYNKGLLSREQLDGIDLTWGNYEGIIELLQRIVQREGIGAVLAKPLRDAGRELGIEELAVHMKGTGFNDHDMRIHPGLIFQTLIASGAGPTWQTSMGLLLKRATEAGGGDPDLGVEYLDPASADGLGETIYQGQLKKLWQDTTGTCWNALNRVANTWDPAIRAIATAVGWEGYNRAEALLVGERIVNLQRLMSLHLGYKPEYDFDISQRLLEPLPGGPAAGQSLPAGPYLAQWREEYYRCLGWDPDTGAPLPEALDRVDLADFRVGQD